MTKVEKLKEKIAVLNSKISEIQEACPHINVSKKGHSDTGNWCSADDSYWWEFRCADCDKFWTEDQ